MLIVLWDVTSSAVQAWVNTPLDRRPKISDDSVQSFLSVRVRIAEPMALRLILILMLVLPSHARPCGKRCAAQVDADEATPRTRVVEVVSEPESSGCAKGACRRCRCSSFGGCRNDFMTFLTSEPAPEPESAPENESKSRRSPCKDCPHCSDRAPAMPIVPPEPPTPTNLKLGVLPLATSVACPVVEVTALPVSTDPDPPRSPPSHGERQAQIAVWLD